MPTLPGKPALWLGAVSVWFATLWYLSSSTHPDLPGSDIRFFDKFEHFGYFFLGGTLLTTWRFRQNPQRPLDRSFILSSIAILALVGASDEFHQSFVYGRSGNDPFDLTADILGATAGCLFFRAAHRRIKWLS